MSSEANLKKMLINIDDALAIVRFVMMLLTIAFFLIIYFKLRFRGFITLAGACTVTAITLLLVETYIIESTGTTYEVILFIRGILFLASAILIYQALMKFLKNNHQQNSN
jgi:uncharacterized membrane-anchored protein